MAKIKSKTCKTAVKRFKVTATGKILRGHIGHGHLLSKKSSARKRRLTTLTEISPSDYRRIKGLLPK